MSELRGYTKRALELLKSKQLGIGDLVEIVRMDDHNATYTGIIMPRYEHADDMHIVIKLKSGYNVGISLKKIQEIKKIDTDALPNKKIVEKAIMNNGSSKEENIKDDSSQLPKILLLSTGGTIASKIDYRTGAVTPTLTAKELNESIPELRKIANITAKVVLSEYSENIVPQNWLQIANKVAEEYTNSKQYTGIIIAHGTDTMHYTSSYLSFALTGFPLPIALVGSQRSSDRASSDAALNLIAATKFLVNCKTNGVYIVMHQDTNDQTVACHIGTRARKNHTSKRGAFQTIGGDPAFLVTDNKISQNVLQNTFFESQEFIPKIKLDEKVVLIKYYPGYDPNILEKIIESNVKAIIFEGTGLGHIGKNMYSVIKTARQKGIFMGMTSQCIDGRVRMTVYESGRDLLNLGITPLEDMIAEVALVKAMWVVGNTQNYDEIKKMMLQKFASEFSTGDNNNG